MFFIYRCLTTECSQTKKQLKTELGVCNDQFTIYKQHLRSLSNKTNAEGAKVVSPRLFKKHAP